LIADDLKEVSAIRFVQELISSHTVSTGARELEARMQEIPAWSTEILELYGKLEQRDHGKNEKSFLAYKEWRKRSLDITPEEGLREASIYRYLSREILNAESAEEALEIARAFIEEPESSA